MSEQADAMAEAVENDTTDLDSEPALVTDEDRLGDDPLEDGMDTPEDYSRELRFGQREESESLAYRLPQEEPDPALDEVDLDPGRPLAATPVDDLDESVDTDGEPEERGDEIELGLDSAVGSNELTGLPADDSIGTAAPVERGSPTEGAEQEALRVEQEY